MATYSGLFNTVYTDGSTATGTGVPVTQVFNSDAMGDWVKDAFGKLGRKRSGRILNELIVKLTGTAPGAAALVTERRVAAVTPLTTLTGGGLVTIETKDYLNRVTTAADATTIDAAAQMVFYPTSYPVDRSGNGGGGKLKGFGA